MGEAVPVVQEETEMVDRTTKTTTDNGLSTWILLNNVASSTTTPKTTTTPATTTKKITKKPQFQLKSTLKPTLKTTTIRPETKDKPSIIRKNKNTKKPTPSPTSVSTTLSILETKPTKKPTTTTTTTTFRPTVESTTFLILEPKDADFDLPQDRSPGTTKKPKRKPLIKGTNSKKKNQVKVAGEKKPSKGPGSNDKPLTTKIYNYLAREVMPTVGVGLVGLTVAAGLATYFLGPFGALRRSYDNASDRKDDFYRNDDEYGGSGQSEEEVFGKVIAGMPANSPYRNSMKYNAYHRNNQPLQRPSNSAGIRIVQAPPQHYRVRNSGYVQSHMPSYMSTKRNDDRTQIYRYNSEPNGMSYKQQQKASEVSLTTSVPLVVTDSTTQSSYYPAYSSSSEENVAIVTPSSVMEEEGDLTQDKPTNHKYPSADIPDSTNAQQMDNNVLKKRTNFVVGTVLDANNEDNDLLEDMPEHGPRRRRQTTGNELDAVLPVEEVGYTYEKPLVAEPDPNEEPAVTDSDYKVTESSTVTESPVSSTVPEAEPRPTTKRPPVIVTVDVQSPRPNIFEFVKSLFEFKLRMGLNFLQQTTQNFQRVLKHVEKSVDESKFFNKNFTMTSRTPRPRTTTTKQTLTTITKAPTTKQPSTSNE